MNKTQKEILIAVLEATDGVTVLHESDEPGKTFFMIHIQDGAAIVSIDVEGTEPLVHCNVVPSLQHYLPHGAVKLGPLLEEIDKAPDLIVSRTVKAFLTNYHDAVYGEANV